MNPQQNFGNQPPQFLVQELIRLFDIYIEGPEGCRERAYRLLQQYPNNLKVIEIVAACDSLVGKYTEAVAGYQKCLQLSPKTLAYVNNQAWNFIQLKDYEIAMTLLSDIIDKWNHPVIYTNWAVILQNIKGSQKALQETIQKRDKFLRDYPQYRRDGNNELIHTFLLKTEENNTGQSQDLRAEVLELTQALKRIERAPLNIQTLKERIQFMDEKIKQRKRQEQKSGFVIDPQYKISLAGLQILETKVLKHYQGKYSKQLDLDKYVIKSIQFIRDYILAQKIGDDFDFKTFEETKMVPTLLQVAQIGELIQQKIQNLLAQRYIPSQSIQPVNEPQKNQIPESVEYPSIAVPQNPKKTDIEVAEPINLLLQDSIPSIEPVRPLIDLTSQRLDSQTQKFRVLHNKNEFDQIEKQIEPHIIEKLRLEGSSSTNPIFVILHSRQKMQDYYTIFINHRRVNQQILNQLHIPELSRLKQETQKSKIKRYYLIFKNMLKFYNFYGTHNFMYERKNVRSDPGCLHFIELISPVLNHIFAQEEIFAHYQVGNIIKNIHNIISSYINQTTKKGNFLRSFNKILKRINEVVESCQNPVQDLIQNILKQKNLSYSVILLSNQLINIDGSTRFHEYFIQKMNKSQESKQDQNWLAFNVSLLLISLLENSEQKQSLEERFVDCYYLSKINQPIRNTILKKYFNANPNNKIPLAEKMGSGIKKLFTLILP